MDDIDRLVSQAQADLDRVNALCSQIDSMLSHDRWTILNESWMDRNYPLPKSNSSQWQSDSDWGLSSGSQQSGGYENLPSTPYTFTAAGSDQDGCATAGCVILVIAILAIVGLGLGAPVMSAGMSRPNSMPAIFPSDIQISDCTFQKGGKFQVRDNARVWDRPDVMSGAVIRNLPASALVYIVDGPKWGRIRRDIDVSGWWWQISEVPGENGTGWIWEGRIAGCNSSQ